MRIENFMIWPCVIQYVFREKILPMQINANLWASDYMKW